MSDPYLQLCERIKDEAGGVACKIGLLEGWLKFQADGGYPILPTQPFILEAIRNAHELAVLKIFHLLDANKSSDVCLLRLQRALEDRINQSDESRGEVTRIGRELKRVRATVLPTLKDYRDRKVAHPNIALPTNPALTELRRAATDLFAMLDGYQQFMLGSLNYEAEVQTYRDSFVGVLHAVSVESAHRALKVSLEDE